MYFNGFIIKEYNNGTYKGIDGSGFGENTANNWYLNENGLFQTKEEIMQYISKREEYEKTHKPYTLEVGDFTIFEVYEVVL